MTWTTDIPKVSGVYWMKQILPMGIHTMPVEVEVNTFMDVHVYFLGTDEVIMIDGNVTSNRQWEWYGPLEVPEDGVLVEGSQDAYECVCSKCQEELHLMGTGGCSESWPT